jgi:hypothetical protein
MKHSVPVLFFLCLTISAHAGPQRLLEDPEAWTQVGGDEASFRFHEGELATRNSGEEPSTLFTVEDYENFTASFEFMLSRWGQSGIFIHSPRFHNAIRAALKLQFADSRSGPPPLYDSGALHGRVAPVTNPVKDAGEWNTCEITLDWPHLRVLINGEVVQDLDLSADEATKYGLRRGALGIQNDGSTTRFRNFEVTRLPDSFEYHELFDGETLEGWEVVRGAVEWSVRDGAIYAEDGDGYLRNHMLTQDFDLRLKYRTSHRANGGVFFRWPSYDPETGPDRGHEIQVYDVEDAVMPSGSVYAVDRGNDLAFRPGEWNLLHIVVEGNRAVTLVNGVRSSDSDALRIVRPGHICLQMHSRNAWIEYTDFVLAVND